MRPEPGDRRVKVTRADVAAAVRSVGVVPGDTVMFHSSLSSMGTVVGGPDAVIDGFLDAVGPGGTVAAPTLWLSRSEPWRLNEWDIESSPSRVGLITEAFRRRPDSVRSDNPTHSVSAIGARAVELTQHHGRSGLRLCIFGDRAFARESPWQRFYDWNAAYCFIGVDFTVNTMRHLIESLVVERALEQAPAARREELAGRVSRWDKDGVWPTHDGRAMGERLSQMGLVRSGRIGSATLRCIRAREMVDRTLAILRAEPEQWYEEGFLAWLREAGSGSPTVGAERREPGGCPGSDGSTRTST